MGSTRRSFTDEYKASAVAFVLDEGRPVVEVARNIGVHEMSLKKWVKKERDAREEALGPDATLHLKLRVLSLDTLCSRHEVAVASTVHEGSGDSWGK